MNLTQWVKHIPCRGQYAQSRQRRIRRWLGHLQRPPSLQTHHPSRPGNLGRSLCVCELRHHPVLGAVLSDSPRRTHWFRGNSYFRMGRDWIQAALLDGWQLLKRVLFRLNEDPEPAVASRTQHEKRFYRLEFQVCTRRFKPD